MADIKAIALEADAIIEDSVSESAYKPLAEADYKFRVKSHTVERYNGSDKLPSCKRYVFKLGVKHDGTETEVNWNYFHVSTHTWKIVNMLRSVGLRKPGDKAPIPWDQIDGAEGVAHIIQREFSKNNGGTGITNEVEKFVEPDWNSMTEASSDDLPF